MQTSEIQSLIKAERTAADRFAVVSQWYIGGPTVDVVTARAATDEAVRKVENALRECLITIECGRIASIGGFDNTYCPQIARVNVERWRAVLQAAPAPTAQGESTGRGDER